MSAQQTPTPWRVSGQWSHKTEVSNGDGTVCTCDEGDDGFDHAANAAFIVHACNSHEPTVAAMERLERELRRATTSGLHPYQVREIHEWVYAALSAAQEQP